MLADPFEVALSRHGEELARLLGVMRILALPPLRTPGGGERRRVVEIEVSLNTWARVTGMWVEPGKIVFFFAHADGTRIEYPFVESERIPPWRVDEEYRGPRVLHEVT